MKVCSCGIQLAGNARRCPHCGKRFTSPLTAIFAVVLGIACLGALVAEINRPPEVRAKFDPVETSIGGCQQWTRTHSKLAVDDFVGEYQISKAKLPKGVYKVGLDYRAKGAGLMMHSWCEYKDAGDHDHMVLVNAWSGVE